MHATTFHERARDRLVELLLPHVRRYHNGTFTTRYGRAFHTQVWTNQNETYVLIYTVRLPRYAPRPNYGVTYYVQLDGTLAQFAARHSFSTHTQDDIEPFAQHLFTAMQRAIACGESLSSTSGFGEGKFCKQCPNELKCLMAKEP